MSSKQLNNFPDLPETVMVKVQDPSLSAVSFTRQVTVVRPTRYNSPDLTTLSKWSLQTIVAGLMTKTLSVAVGGGIHEMTAPGIPGSEGDCTWPGQLTFGA